MCIKVKAVSFSVCSNLRNKLALLTLGQGVILKDFRMKQFRSKTVQDAAEVRRCLRQGEKLLILSIHPVRVQIPVFQLAGQLSDVTIKGNLKFSTCFE